MCSNDNGTKIIQVLTFNSSASLIKLSRFHGLPRHCYTSLVLSAFLQLWQKVLFAIAAKKLRGKAWV